jgi:TPR repeat protein
MRRPALFLAAVALSWLGTNGDVPAADGAPAIRPLKDFPVWAKMDGLWKGDLDYLDGEGEFITKDYDALFEITIKGATYHQINWMFYPPGPSAAFASLGLAKPGEGVEVVLNTYGSAIDDKGTMRVDLIDHRFDFEGGELTTVVNEHVALYEYINPKNGVRQHTQMVNMAAPGLRVRSAQGIDPNEYRLDPVSGEAQVNERGEKIRNPRFNKPRSFSLYREVMIPRETREAELEALRKKHNVKVLVKAGPTPQDPSVIRRTDVAVTECDLLANHPFDAERVSAGVAQEKVDTAKAIPACLRDQKADPNNGRLTYQAGRVQFYAGKVKEAYPFLERAAYELDYPQGQFVLGFLHAEGQGVEKDFCKAAVLWRRAALADHFYAQYSFGKAALDGRLAACSVRHTPRETLAFLQAARAKADFTGLEREIDALVERAKTQIDAQ